MEAARDHGSQLGAPQKPAAHATSYGTESSSAMAPTASGLLHHPSPPALPCYSLATPAIDALFASGEQHSLMLDSDLPSAEELEALERRASMGVAALQDLFNIGTCESTCLPGVPAVRTGRRRFPMQPLKETAFATWCGLE